MTRTIQQGQRVTLSASHELATKGEQGTVLEYIGSIETSDGFGMVRVQFDSYTTCIPEEKIDTDEQDPTGSPMWKSHRVAGGWVVYPELCEAQRDGTYTTQWGVDAPFGRGSGSLCAALDEGQYIHEASDEDRDIPRGVLKSIVRLADELSAAGVY